MKSLLQAYFRKFSSRIQKLDSVEAVNRQLEETVKDWIKDWIDPG